MHVKLSENFRAVFYAPFYATHALGFYTTEGVEVELLNSPAPAAAAKGLLDGSIDISWGGPMRVMKARDDNPNSPMVCFCEVASRDPFFLVGKDDPSAFRLTDLARLKVGTVSEVPTPWLCLQHDLRLQGIDPAEIDCVTGRTMADNLEALRHGELDVVQMFEPYVSMALQAGVGEISMRRTHAGRPFTRRTSRAAAAFATTAQPSTPWCGRPAARWPGLRSMARRSWRMRSRRTTRTSHASCWQARCSATTMRDFGRARPTCHGKDSRGWQTA